METYCVIEVHDARIPLSGRNINFQHEDVQGKNCLTQFYGMNLTTDKLRSLLPKNTCQ